MNKNIFNRIVCLAIALMMLMPAMPSSVFGEVIKHSIDADEVHDFYDTSTNKNTVAGAFWYEGDDLHLGFSVLDNNVVKSVSYNGNVSTDITETDEGKNEFIVQIIEKVTSETVSISVGKNNKFVVINFGNVDLGQELNIVMVDSLGKGHDFKDFVLKDKFVKIVKLDEDESPLEGAGFSIDAGSTVLADQGDNENELGFFAKPGVEFSVIETVVPDGYIGAEDFNVKLNSEGTGFTVVGTLPEGVSIDGLTISVVNMEEPELEVSADNVVETYDGEPHGVIAATNIDGAEIKYWDGQGYNLNESPTITNVGVLTVRFQAILGNDTAEGVATVTINPKAVTIDVDDKAKVSGSPDPIFTGSITGLVNANDLGDVTYFRTNSTVNNVGTYTGVIDASYTQNGNYDVTVNKGDFTITQDNILTVEAANVVKTYDGEEYGVTAVANVEGATIKYWDGSDYTLNLSPTISDVSESPLTVKFKATYPDYTSATGEATVTINAKKVTITVADKSKVAGSNDPVFTGSITGLVNANDLGEVSYLRTNSDEAVGTYKEVLDASFTSNTNYEVKVNKGDFTITSKSNPQETGQYYITINHYTKTGDENYVLYKSNDEAIEVTTGSSVRVYGSSYKSGEILESGFVYQSSSPEYLDILAHVTSESAIGTYEFDLKYYKEVIEEEEEDDDDEDDNDNDNDDDDDDYTDITETTVPLADLEKLDHFAYVIGYPEGDVRPLNNITREEVAMIFYRLLTDESRNELLSDTNPFTDLENNEWSNRAISTLFNAGILKGYPDGTFKPSEPVTRAEFATIAAKFDKLELGSASKFTDISGHWAEKYITSSEIKGWIKGYEDLTFKPEQDITRAETMTLINNVLGRIVPEENIHPEALSWTDNSSSEWYYEAVMEATNSHDYMFEDDGDELWTGLKANKVWP